jgi:uncharacterized protein YndB with AHSA1/START domain
MKTAMRSAIGIALLTTVVLAGIALTRTGIYGFTIFLFLPVLLGGVVSWVVQPETSQRALLGGTLAGFAALVSLLSFGLEGLGCLAMAAPLVLPLAAFGSWLVYRARESRAAHRGAAMMLLLTPAGLTFDLTAQPPVFEVRTAITIAAPPERVWKHIVTFAELPEPQEWFFRAGVAYPKLARIEGTGAGAVRYCEFNTGPVVEPIEVWNPPNRLRFRVSENPAPMVEWSPYANVLPKHLHGYLISKEGEFRLTRLEGNRTLLEGTTWYQHGLWPAEYWRWWSDAIIHRVHLRVMSNIRKLAEAEAW